MSISNYTGHHDFIKETLRLEGAIILGYKECGDGFLVQIKMERKPQCCPECGCEITHVHDHRERIIQAGTINGKPVWIQIDRRRLRCASCGKRFYEDVPFLKRYQRITVPVQDDES